MTEKDFWEFLHSLLEQGRVPQVSGVIDSDEPQLQQAGRFIGAHALLPKNYDKITGDKIIRISELLFRREIMIPTKEAVMIILAHHPSREALNALAMYDRSPDKELRYFSAFALEECRMWNGV